MTVIPLTEEQKKMVEDNQRLVWFMYHKMAYRLNHTFYESEDYFQVGIIGLMKAVKNFDPDKSKFATFATVCIANEFRMIQRHVKKKLSPIVTGLDNVEQFAEFGSTDADMVEQSTIDQEDLMVVKSIINQLLTQKERHSVFGYLQEQTQNEIAEEIGVSQSIVSRYQKIAFQKIREKIG